MKKSFEENIEVLPSLAKTETFKDELNFAEFPLALLSDTVDPSLKTITFTDSIFDQSTKQPVTRKLTISASDEYGLPRGLDEEILLGLLKLTDKNNFTERKVHFSIYELIKTLNWNESATSYKRIVEALDRLVGVTLYYDKAWWSKEEQCLVNEKFHILESVTIYDKERRMQSRKLNPHDENAGKSHFVWNEIVFRSFLAGNLKEIDIEVYRELKSNITKRMYRFLDKRFYHKRLYQRNILEFDLAMFAYEKVGISRKTTLSQVKRLLSKPIIELEEIGFLRPLKKEERFQKLKKGIWKVVFEKGTVETRSLLGEDQITALENLKSRGVIASKASKLVRSYSLSKIAEKISFHDWLVLKKDKRCSSNPAGFLVAAIEKDYPMPKGFMQSKDEARSELRVVVNRPLQKQPEVEVESQSDKNFAAWMSSLSDKEKSDIENEALKSTNDFSRRTYLAGKEKGGSLFKAVESNLFSEYFRTLEKAANS